MRVCQKASTFRREQQGDAQQSRLSWTGCVQSQPHAQSPHRLVVRTSRRGRDNPGSTPGEDMYAIFHGQSLLVFGGWT